MSVISYCPTYVRMYQCIDLSHCHCGVHLDENVLLVAIFAVILRIITTIIDSYAFGITIGRDYIAFSWKLLGMLGR